MIDSNNTRKYDYEVRVICRIEKDNKTFSLKNKENTIDYQNKIYRFCKEKLKNKLSDPQIIFLNQRYRNRKSHLISIINLTTKKSKSISIDLRNHSSSEISDTIKQNIGA